jgi:hypothetical protein
VLTGAKEGSMPVTARKLPPCMDACTLARLEAEHVQEVNLAATVSKAYIYYLLGTGVRGGAGFRGAFGEAQTMIHPS